MDFQEIREILNQKLTEIWAYRRYTTPEEILKYYVTIQQRKYILFKK